MGKYSHRLHSNSQLHPSDIARQIEWEDAFKLYVDFRERLFVPVTEVLIREIRG